MTQIVFMLFEDISKPEDSLDKYHVDIHFSPGIKGRAELITDGSSSLVKKSSPELPEKSLQVFVKRISHGSIIGSSEGGTSGAGIAATGRTKSAGDNLSSMAVPTTTHGDFFRRYVTASRSTTATTSSSTLSPKDMLGRRRGSTPNPLRSFSDTRLTDKASRIEEELKEEEVESNGNGQPHRKKCVSEGSMQELTFRIGGPTTSHRSKSDGDMTEDESLSPTLRTSSKLAGSSPDLNRVRFMQTSEKQTQECTTAKGPVKKLSAPSITYRSVCTECSY